ncbi:MAG: sulfur oxidation c-type cytochrome SoxA [Proteobacteria bacterium]|nr:sulfur oxidation c-type cytochrome SoxA [Pseudomonadota bacterium]
MIRRTLTTALLALGLTMGVAASAAKAAGDKWGKYEVEDRRSGYTYMTPETQSMQDDMLQNPAGLWLDRGQELWSKKEGDAGKACASCHNDAAKTMKGVATRYPVYVEKLGKLENIEQRINRCRTENMKAKAWKWESDELLGMTIYVNNQSYGMPVNVSIDGPAIPFFNKGKEFYYQPRGQLDMACKQCHEDQAGNMIRANLLSEGQVNGFPTYRLNWQKPGSMHRRFRGCNSMVRSTPYGYGSDEYNNLELYVTWRGRGLPVETPAVRN